MLRISKLTDYATVILSYMARGGSEMHAAVEISSATGVALPTVSKLLKMLTKEKIVNSIRGSKGGYFLSRNPEKITIASVICAVEGPIALTECSLSVDNCQQSGDCQIRANWGVINRVVATALESVTLSDMVMPACDFPAAIKMPVEEIMAQQRR